MAKQEKLLLKDAIKEYAPKEEFVFVHKYNIPGYFKYNVSEMNPKMLMNEVIVVNKHFGGIEYEYNAVMFIVK